MVQSKKKLGKSEITLIKEYCSRLSDEDLQSLSALLPQTIAGDTSRACDWFQGDLQIDRWLSQAMGADDWFARVDGIGELVEIELNSRLSKKK
jgi:predicted RNA-binding Zn ribbon-like protein